MILDGYDPVAFFTDNKPVKGDPEISTTWHEATYHFASKEHKTTFDAMPEKYAPQFGGNCGYAVSLGHLAPIDVNFFSIIDGRLILQHNQKALDNWNGKKLNSPNDLVLKSDGTVYFTNPPYGLPMNYFDPKKETPHQGVYRIKNGQAELLSTDLCGPNGIVFSPDEKWLYVGNWDIRDIWNTKSVWRFPLNNDGTLGKGEVFFNFNQTEQDEAIDGIKVDVAGNLFVSAPGGVWVLSPDARILGKITGPERPANMAWGDDGKTLYLTAHTGLYKIRVKTGGKIAGKGLSSR